MRNYKLYLTNDIIVDKVIRFFFNYPNLVSVGSLIILGQILSFSLFKVTSLCDCGDFIGVLNILIGGLISFTMFFIYVLIYANIKIIEDIDDNYLKDNLFHYYNKDKESRPLYTWEAKSFNGTYCQFCIFLQDNPQYEAFR